MTPAARETLLAATDPATGEDELWRLARDPELRRWIIANTAAPAALINEIARKGGPGVPDALAILMESLSQPGASAAPGA